MTLTDIAKAIDAHLRRFEADPQINAERHYESPITGQREIAGRPYYRAGAWRGGRYVMVKYISFQNAAALTREQAEAYLAWLDAGNVGRHYKMMREKERQAS